jgi:hypothetical protein
VGLKLDVKSCTAIDLVLNDKVNRIANALVLGIDCWRDMGFNSVEILC